jgi:hypothetical protein
MRDVINSIVLIILLGFYCFESSNNSNFSEFCEVNQPVNPNNNLYLLQTFNDCNFCFTTRNNNLTPALPQQKVLAGKKHLNYISKTILTRITFHGLMKERYFMTEQYSFKIPSHILLMIVPSHWFT